MLCINIIFFPHGSPLATRALYISSESSYIKAFQFSEALLVASILVTLFWMGSGFSPLMEGRGMEHDGLAPDSRPCLLSDDTRVVFPCTTYIVPFVSSSPWFFSRKLLPNPVSSISLRDFDFGGFLKKS